MTRTTRVAVLTPGIDPETMWAVMATALRAPEQYAFTETLTSIKADLGQDLDALMRLTFAEHGAQVPQVACDDCEPGCRCSWIPAHYLMASFDTIYSYTGECGCQSGGLHIQLVTEVGSWLDSIGASWAWFDESGNGWDHGADWGTLVRPNGACAAHGAIPAPQADPLLAKVETHG